MKTLKIAGLTAAAAMTALCMAGCEKVADNTVTYDGDRTLSSSEQTAVYVAREDAEATITSVRYWLIDAVTEENVANGEKTAEECGDVFEFDFFTVCLSGQNIVLDIKENDSGCYREITVALSYGGGYDAQELTITQLPAEDAGGQGEGDE